jgi:1-acyl-sn-glycerol-3-phosphate acyltransferase
MSPPSVPPAVSRRLTGRPGPYAGIVPELVRGFCLAFLRLSGWTIHGDWPAINKAVLVAAPHTSNWDGIYMLAAAGCTRIKLRWMGKKSLTTGPFGGLVKALGCVPIDRAASHDVVKAMTDAFAAHDQMILAIPPEGTRSLTQQWKSGFYHIAHSAQVPIILSVLDYGTRTMRIGAVIHPTGDYDTDLALIQSHYAGAVGKHRAMFSVS